MPSGSSTTAPVTFLDRDAVVRALRSAAERLIADDSNVAAVVLFGSLATRTATPSSDADLLVVVRSDRRRMLDRMPDYTRPFETPGMGVQVLPWNLDELRARLEAADRFAKKILDTGELLAGSLSILKA